MKQERGVTPTAMRCSGRLIRSLVAAMGVLAVALGSVPASADFGAFAGAGVEGNCETEDSFQNNGGSLINAIQAAAGRTGATTFDCRSVYPAGGWSGRSYSYASLGTGQLKVFATSQGPEATISLFPTGEPKNVRAQARAQFFDTTRLIPPVGFLDEFALIEVRLDVTVTTTLAPGADPLKNESFVFWRLNVNGIQSFTFCDHQGALTPFSFCPNFGPIVLQVLVPIADPRVNFFAELFAITVNNATADASATGTLSFVLPPGFSLDSGDSGVLLTTTSPVPVSVAGSASPDPVTATDSLTYTVVVTNNSGSDAATGVTLIDMLPAGVTFDSASPSQGTCSSNGFGLVTCALGTLAGGASATVTIVGIPMVLGEITNSATVIAKERDLNSADNRATITTMVDLPPVFAGGGQGSEVNDFLRYVQPLQSSTDLPAGTTSFDLMIVYGPTIDAATFEATLNGAPLAGFTPIPNRLEIVPIPLTPGRHVLSLKVSGVKSSGQTATDRERLVFIVP